MGKGLKPILLWTAIYIPAVVLCFASFILNTVSLWAMAIGGGTFSNNIFIDGVGIFVLPPVILCISTFIYLKLSESAKLQLQKKYLFAFFWIPFLTVFYLLLLAPSLLILIIIAIFLSPVIVLIGRNFKYKHSKI